MPKKTTIRPAELLGRLGALADSAESGGVEKIGDESTVSVTRGARLRSQPEEWQSFTGQVLVGGSVVKLLAFGSTRGSDITGIDLSTDSASWSYPSEHSLPVWAVSALDLLGVEVHEVST